MKRIRGITRILCSIEGNRYRIKEKCFERKSGNTGHRVSVKGPYSWFRNWMPGFAKLHTAKTKQNVNPLIQTKGATLLFQTDQRLFREFLFCLRLPDLKYPAQVKPEMDLLFDESPYVSLIKALLFIPLAHSINSKARLHISLVNNARCNAVLRNLKKWDPPPDRAPKK